MKESNKGNILFVVNDLPNIATLVEFLGQSGFNVQATHNGSDAIKIVQQSQPDLVVLDTDIADSDIFELAYNLQSIDPSIDLPIFFLTTIDDIWDQLKRFNPNVVDFAKKPFARNEVLFRIEKLLTVRDKHKNNEEQSLRLAQINREMRSREERYRFLFTESLEGMVFFGGDGVITEVNQHLARMVGYEIDELVGGNVLTFFPPEEREHALERAQKVGAGQTVPITERTIIRKDGSTFLGEANLSPIKDADGNLLYILGVVRDLTERKQLEEALREKEAQLRQIGDNLPNGMIYRLVHTPDGHRYITYMSEGVERLYGITVEEAMQDPNILYGMMPPEDLEAATLAEEESIKNLDRFDWEGRFRLRSGEIRWSHYHSKPSVLPDGTRIWDGVALDITQHKRLDEELSLSEERARALLNASIDAAVLIKIDGTIVALNQTMAHSLGGIPETLIGQNVYEFFPADLSRLHRSRAEKVIESGAPIQFEDISDGQWFRTQLYPLFDENGQVSQLAIYSHDITDVQDKAIADERIRIARELHDSVTQTMYSVSIVAEAMPRLLDRDQAEARRRAVHLRQMTLGALAEMRNLLFEFHPKALRDTGLNILVEQLGEVLTGRTRIPVDLTIEGEMQVPEDVKIIFYRVAQETFNNITKYASATQVTAVLKSGPNGCKLSISDNGSGFDLNAVNSDKLGLKFMRERAAEIGGDLRVVSAPNHGTQVSLIWSGLPAEKS